MKLTIPIDCPKCDKKFEEKVINLKPGNTIICPHCNSNIKLSGDDLSGIQKELDNFDKTLNLLKNIKIG